MFALMDFESCMWGVGQLMLMRDHHQLHDMYSNAFLIVKHE